MSIWNWIGIYLLTCVVTFIFAIFTRDDGYGSMFPSCAGAIVLNMFWPMWLTLLVIGLAVGRLGPVWDRVERWWDCEAEEKL